MAVYWIFYVAIFQFFYQSVGTVFALKEIFFGPAIVLALFKGFFRTFLYFFFEIIVCLAKIAFYCFEVLGEDFLYFNRTSWN